MGAAAFRYWAFISYSRADESLAKWLHGSIERYTLPRALVGRTMGDITVPRRLFPLFRDRDELPTSSSLGAALEEALRQSRSLIVLCSPHAAASRWVNEEIARFKLLGRGDRILCVIVGGVPNAGAGADTAGREAFPAALRNTPDAGAEDPSAPSDAPLAADLRPFGDGKQLSLLKVVAGLLRLPLDELIARDRRRRRWRIVQSTAALLLVLLLGSAVWLNEHRKTQVERNVADLQTLATKAQGLLAGDIAQMPTAALLALTAWRRSLELNRPAEQMLDVMRHSASLLPRPAAVRLQTDSSVGRGAASADGRWLATRGDGRVLLWNARSGKLKASLRTGDAYAVAFTADGKLRVVVDEAVQTWMPASAERIESRHIDGLMYPVALSANGRWLTAGFGSAIDIAVWDLTTWALTRRVQVDVPASALAISSNGQHLAAGVAGSSNSGPVDPGWRLWDVNTGHRISSGKLASFADTLEFSPSGRALAVGSGTVELLEAATGRQLLPLRGSASGIVWASNERWVAGSGSTVQVWDAETGDEVARVVEAGGAVTFGADGTKLVTGDGRYWTMDSGRQFDHLLATPGRTRINSIRFGGTTHLATASQAGDVVTWQLDEVVRSPTLREGLSARVVALSQDGRFALTMSGNTLGSMWSGRLWSVQDGRNVAELSPGGHIDAAAFNADGSRLGIIDDEGVLTLYATSDGSAAAHAQVRPSDGGYTLILIPGTERWIVLGGGAAWLWHAGGGEPKFLNIGENPIFHVAVSGDGKTLWQVGPGLVVARDPVTLAEKLRMENIPDRVHALAVNHDGSVIAAAMDRAIRIFDRRAGRESFDMPLPEGETSVRPTHMAISPDAHWLGLVVQHDEPQNLVSDVSLWSLDRRGRIATLEQGVDAAEFSSDGTRLAVIASDQSARMVEWIPTRLIANLCARLSRDLTARERDLYRVPDELSACSKP